MHDVNSATPHGAETNITHTVDYLKFDQEPQFQQLRKRQRSFVFPMAVFFLAWYFAFVLLAAYAPQFMATPIVGTINLGLLLGLAQFLTTFTITMWYVRFANAKLDPQAQALREQLAAIEAGTPIPAVSTRSANSAGSAVPSVLETEGTDRA
ncbi:DUF485 domain-containing protein [Gulosibacter chungangensis]|uniref:DUF485 domain-containing protein n=1 Tax=Gulosibacter chungangensis TaxID=979746 RepID=A0A7J5BA47_9MICO|nr:DUF485 domain-containing protein [Gulosibacter chungangensis]KAB1642629.1 DUF485 domain-containing protein [Gulosibacter chungangensis]